MSPTSQESSQGRYEAYPFIPSPDRADIVSKIMRGVASYETIFSDYVKACDKRCWECPQCLLRLRAVAYILSNPDAFVWEVWELDAEGGAIDVVGIIYLTRITLGVDAVAHYVFFDGNLSNKTSILRSMAEWFLTDHQGWKGLQRLSLEIPTYAFTLARHAVRRLGFGGGFRYKGLNVEGVRKAAILWRGAPHDLILLGRYGKSTS